MITEMEVLRYCGATLNRGDGYLYISPHKTLLPYISCYTITFPTDMPDAYTVLPTASSTIVMSVSADHILGGLRGVNTKACNVGEHANKMRFLLLIEFRPGGLYPFAKINQFELTDNSFPLFDIDGELCRAIEIEILKTDCVEHLIQALDRILIARLTDYYAVESVTAMMRTIFVRNGNINLGELSSEFYYSEKQIRRLFLQYIGASPKELSRIVRVNFALRTIGQNRSSLTDVAAQARYFDQPHMIRDFKAICGITPQQYMQNMSVFYIDEYKV